MKTLIEKDLMNCKERSQWGRAVKAYCLELLETLEVIPSDGDLLKKELLNGAQNWADYSCGGCSLIYNADIAERVCTPSELKRKKGGELQPNSRETWLDCQARALHQASTLIIRSVQFHNRNQ